MGSPSSRWVVSCTQLLLGAVASGLVVRSCMGVGVLVVLLGVRYERIDRCLLRFGGTGGGSVGGFIFGNGIVGRECFRVFCASVTAALVVDLPLTTFTGGLVFPQDRRGHSSRSLRLTDAYFG